MAGPHVFKKAVDDDNLLTSCQGNGPYYNTMDGFANMRAEWFDMLQKITGGGDVTELANAAVESSNAGMAG